MIPRVWTVGESGTSVYLGQVVVFTLKFNLAGVQIGADWDPFITHTLGRDYKTVACTRGGALSAPIHRLLIKKPLKKDEKSMLARLEKALTIGQDASCT